MMMASSTETQLISEVAGEVMTIISQWVYIHVFAVFCMWSVLLAGGGFVVFCGRCFFPFPGIIYTRLGLSISYRNVR